MTDPLLRRAYIARDAWLGTELGDVLRDLVKEVERLRSEVERLRAAMAAKPPTGEAKCTTP